jgi:hypothetical protein
VQVKKALEGYEHECIDVFIIVILAILFIYGEKVESWGQVLNEFHSKPVPMILLILDSVTKTRKTA